jgi:hypothetical protein
MPYGIGDESLLHSSFRLLKLDMLMFKIEPRLEELVELVAEVLDDELGVLFLCEFEPRSNLFESLLLKLSFS